MKAGKLLEELEEFQRWLTEFERQKRSLLGRPVPGGEDDVGRQVEQVHYSLDDFRLSLIRKYHRLRAFIETYSCCFRSVTEDGSPGEEIYEVLIEGSSVDFAVLYDDLEQMCDRIRRHDPNTRLDAQGQPLEK